MGHVNHVDQEVDGLMTVHQENKMLCFCVPTFNSAPRLFQFFSFSLSETLSALVAVVHPWCACASLRPYHLGNLVFQIATTTLCLLAALFPWISIFF
jgi:hypothetical protein